jgi:hypothetical protein
VWCGSIGAIYRFDLGVRLARVLGIPLTVYTREVELARAQLGGVAAEVRELSAEQVPAHLRAGDIGLCLYAESPANEARAPTRFAEYLAAGMVVAVWPSIGDLDRLVAAEQVGVQIEDESDDALARSGRRLLELAADPAVRRRGRELASARYSVADGSIAYGELYETLAGGRTASVG